MNNIKEKLSKHKSSTPSRWREEAEFRTTNKSWLRYSQHIAMVMLDKMEEQNMTQKQQQQEQTQQHITQLIHVLLKM